MVYNKEKSLFIEDRKQIMTHVDSDEDLLEHYGVLGMKWGQRRSRINANKSSKYKKKATQEKKAGNIKKAQKYEDKAIKTKNKSEKIKQKHMDRAGKKAYNYVKNQGMGKTLLKSMTMGTYGALKYDQARSNDGKKRFSAYVNSLGPRFLDSMTLGTTSVIEPRLSARSRRKERLNKGQ